MTKKSRNQLLLGFLGLALLFSGFLTGWVLSRHLVFSPEESEQAGGGRVGGDAPESLRRDVLQALAGFQEGYTRRDVEHLDEFMQQFFWQVRKLWSWARNPASISEDSVQLRNLYTMTGSTGGTYDSTWRLQ